MKCSSFQLMYPWTETKWFSVRTIKSMDKVITNVKWKWIYMFHGISMHGQLNKHTEKSKTSPFWKFEAWAFFCCCCSVQSFYVTLKMIFLSRLKKKQRFNLWRQKFMASLHARGVEIEEVSFLPCFSCLNCPVFVYKL